MLDKLKRLEYNISRMKELKFRIESEKELFNNNFLDWALRYSLIETIQNIIDIACHLTGKYNLGNPETYSECIQLLGKYNYIPMDLSLKLSKAVGLRNLLIHEYTMIEDEKLKTFLNDIQDFQDFANTIQGYI